LEIIFELNSFSNNAGSELKIYIILKSMG